MSDAWRSLEDKLSTMKRKLVKIEKGSGNNTAAIALAMISQGLRLGSDGHAISQSHILEHQLKVSRFMNRPVDLLEEVEVEDIDLNPSIMSMSNTGWETGLTAEEAQWDESRSVIMKATGFYKIFCVDWHNGVGGPFEAKMRLFKPNLKNEPWRLHWLSFILPSLYLGEVPNMFLCEEFADAADREGAFARCQKMFKEYTSGHNDPRVICPASTEELKFILKLMQ